MEYVAIGVLAILVIGGGVTVIVMRAVQGSTPASPESGDDTPLGDTPQHSDQSSHAEGRGPARQPEEPEGGRFKRDPIGGEAEAEPTIDTGDPPRAG